MGSKIAVAYVRCSSAGQELQAQEHELRTYANNRGWTIRKVYRDRGVSGAKSSRPGLDQLFSDCRQRKQRIDVVLVWKFDRFARSLRQLASALEEFRALGIAFCSATEAIDTSVPHGELVFQILGAIAQWERSLIAERVISGLQHARRQGKRLGRPPLRTLSREEVKQLRNARLNHKTAYRILARQFQVSLWAAHQLCKS